MNPKRNLILRAQLAMSLLASTNFAQALAEKQPTPIEIARREREQAEKKRLSGLTGLQKEIADYNLMIDRKKADKKQTHVKNYRKQRK